MFDSNKFEVEVVSKSSFIDDVKSRDEKKTYYYNVTVYVIRLSSAALNEYIMSEIFEERYAFRTDEEWKAYCEEKQMQRAEFIAEIAEKLGISPSPDGLTVTKVVSEMFTVVLVEEIML